MEERRSTHAEDPAVEKICGIVGNTSNIRNIAVIARVDHGRHTTVATLVSQAGQVYYYQRLFSTRKNRTLLAEFKCGRRAKY